MSNNHLNFRSHRVGDSQYIVAGTMLGGTRVEGPDALEALVELILALADIGLGDEVRSVLQHQLAPAEEASDPPEPAEEASDPPEPAEETSDPPKPKRKPRSKPKSDTQ